jgi:deoxycytidylate deaminase
MLNALNFKRNQMEKNNINEVFQKLRNEFIIIGLTGAVGSGCTTVANFLSQVSNKEIEQILNCYEKVDKFDLEFRRLSRIENFYSKHKWIRFYHIRVSDLLLLLMVSQINDTNNFPNFNHFMTDKTPTSTQEIFVNNSFNSLKELATEYIDILKRYDDKDSSNIIDILDKTSQIIKSGINKQHDMYTPLFQALGQNIRTYNSIFNRQGELSESLGFEYNNLPIFIIPELIRRTIKLLRKAGESFFTIDAFRNNYEIEFFRNRYQSFYLLSILASEEQRKSRILKDFALTEKAFEEIKTFETSDDTIESQAIKGCIGKGDIFINNDSSSISKSAFYTQLLKYIALIRKPGLITPTDDERFMQVAFTARYSSGCISRQVGAAITGADGYIRGFGWNDVPEKHISCLYRTPQQLLSCSDNTIFSTYERSEKFYSYLYNSTNINSQDLPFCFKDKQNDIELDQKVNSISKKMEWSISKDAIKDILTKSKLKNPTRERALHAEENAFLQISKSGGQSVVGGTLYTTDSPCQLCAKKTMQLKISRVVYIDAYPDISETHTLKGGPENCWPQFEMFSGAIGSAYFKLYIPIIGIKDEINKII